MTTRSPRRIMLVASLLALALMLVAAVAQADVNGFEASDGNQTCETGTDWACLSQPIARVDDASGASDDIFTSASKELQPDSWGITTGAPVNKGDIQALWSAVANNADDSSYLYLAFKRLNGTGQGFFSFELNQVRSTWTNSTGTTIPCRTNGDVLVSFEVPSTGTQANLTLYKWVGDTGNPGPASCPDGKSGSWTQFPMTTDQSAGSINATSSIDTNVLSGPLNGATFAPGTFGEAAIDLPGIATDLGFSKTCEFFQGLSAHSRSAVSITSAMQDVVGSVPLLVPACKPPSGGGGGTPTPPGTPTIAAQQAACNPSSTVTVSGMADPGDQVLVKEGTTTVAIGDADPATGAWSADVLAATDGTHAYTAQAVDGDGNVSSLSGAVSVFVDSTPDATTTITTPADGASIDGGALTLAGEAEPGSVVTVQEGASTLGTSTAAGDGSWSLPLSGIADGSHTYTASATDGCNPSANVASVTVTTTGGGSGSNPGGGDTGGGGSNPGGGTTPVTGSEPSSNPPAATKANNDQKLLGLPASCALKRFRSFVPDTKHKLRRVIFKVDGKVVATARKRDRLGQFVATIDPTKMKVGAHKLTATLVYKQHGKRARTVTKRFRHCDKCQSRRSFRIHIAKLHDDKVVRAAVYVNGKRVKVVRGKRLSAPVVLKGLPKGAFKVVIRATTAKGRTITSTRTYHTCVAKRLGGKRPTL